MSLEPIIKMAHRKRMIFEFSGVPETEWSALQKELESSNVPLNTKQTLRIHSRDGYLLFEYEDGLSFYRCTTDSQSPLEIFQDYLKNPIIPRYMPATYEIDADNTVPQKVLDQFQEHYGWRAAQHINWMTTEWQGRHLLMILIPQEIVAAMMREQGGNLVSNIRGPAGSLRAIPTMKPLIPETVPDKEIVRRLFATQYGKDQYASAFQFHSELVKEVIMSSESGISLGPIGAWYP